MGARMYMQIKSKTKGIATENSVSASLEAAWSGVAASVAGTASFGKELSQTSSISSSEIIISQSGQDRGKGVKHVTIEKATDEIVRFAEISKKGTPQSTYLHKLSSHRDYIATQTNPDCKTDEFEPKRPRTNIENMLYRELVTLKTVYKWLVPSNAPKYIPEQDANDLLIKVYNDIETIEKVSHSEVKFKMALEYCKFAKARI